MSVVDKAAVAMVAIQEILSESSELGAAKTVRIGASDITDYAGRQLPAIGIEWMNLSNSERGQETVDGFCEIVMVGDRKAAMQSVREIGAAVYDILKRYTVRGAKLTQRIQGVSSEGMRKIQGETDKGFVALVHVFWRVEL